MIYNDYFYTFKKTKKIDGNQGGKQFFFLPYGYPKVTLHLPETMPFFTRVLPETMPETFPRVCLDLV